MTKEFIEKQSEKVRVYIETIEPLVDQMSQRDVWLKSLSNAVDTLLEALNVAARESTSLEDETYLVPRWIGRAEFVRQSSATETSV